MSYAKEEVSDCCGAAPVGVSDDLGICPECMDHCTYIELECDRCGGAGAVVRGDGPDEYEVPCPDCGDEPDPDAWYDHKKSTLL